MVDAMSKFRIQYMLKGTNLTWPVTAPPTFIMVLEIDAKTPHDAYQQILGWKVQQAPTDQDKLFGILKTADILQMEKLD